jgi:hypothetical protein
MSVNSSTFSSDVATADHRRYVALLLSLLGMAIAPLWVLWFYLEPLAGDVTRLGWYAEKDFGGRAPQYYFTRPLSTYGSSYDQYYDVVVIGDSFSWEPSGDPPQHPNHWHNFLVDMTGWSLLVRRSSEASLPEFLSNPTFVSSPPKVLIYEQVERNMNLWFTRVSGEPCDGGHGASDEPLPPLHPLHALRMEIHSKSDCRCRSRVCAQVLDPCSIAKMVRSRQ